jgi:hypothetical protein
LKEYARDGERKKGHTGHAYIVAEYLLLLSLKQPVSIHIILQVAATFRLAERIHILGQQTVRVRIYDQLAI